MTKSRGGRPRVPITQRLMSKMQPMPDGCWEWQGGRTPTGYGVLFIGSRREGNRRPAHAHRVAYEEYVGPIPEGLVIDHLCRNRACINPDHMEPVTIAENVLRGIAPSARNARKTHCHVGHEFTPENTYVNRDKRYCRACHRIWRASHAKRATPVGAALVTGP